MVEKFEEVDVAEIEEVNYSSWPLRIQSLTFSLRRHSPFLQRKASTLATTGTAFFRSFLRSRPRIASRSPPPSVSPFAARPRPLDTDFTCRPPRDLAPPLLAPRLVLPRPRARRQRCHLLKTRIRPRSRRVLAVKRKHDLKGRLPRSTGIDRRRLQAHRRATGVVGARESSWSDAFGMES